MVAAQSGRERGTPPQRRRAAPRRNNAPVRPYRAPRGSGLGDLFIAGGVTALSMALVLVAGSFMDNVVAGEAGTTLAQIFGGLLGLGGILLVLAGVAALGEERGQADHYAVPIMAGMAAGTFTTLFILSASPGTVMLLPLLLLIFALRPVRAGISSLLRGVTGQRR